MTARPDRRWWALGALAVAMLTIGLDTTILNVALPTLATDLHASTGQLQWFSTAYTLVLAAAMLPGGMLGDRFGRKRLLVAALLVFGAASAACAYAGSVGAFIAARACLGLGAALMMPLSVAVLPVLFPDERERARALTIWVTATSLGLPLGPIVGGYLLDTFWWGSIFLINVPLVVVGVLAVGAYVPESRSTQARRIDGPGIALSSLGLLGFTYGFIGTGQHGWSDAGSLAAICAGAVLLAGFLVWQRRAPHPLIDLALFRHRGFAWGTLLSTLVMFAMFGLLFAMPQYFQEVSGTDSLGVGLRLLPWIGGMVVGTRVADTLARRIGYGAVIGGGFALLAAALLVGATTRVGTGYGAVAAWTTALGVGLGFAMPSAMAVALNALDAERSGSGSGLMQALRQAGGTIGVAILGTVLNSGYHARLHVPGLPAHLADTARESVSAGVAVAHRLRAPDLLYSVRSAFVHGMGLMLLVCAGVMVLGAIVAVVSLPRRPRVRAGDRAESVHEHAA